MRRAVRRLWRTPTFTVITVLSVAFGIGTFGSILSVVDGVLLEAPPYGDVSRLVWVWRDYTWANFPRGWLGGPDIALLRERTAAFEAVVGLDAERSTLTAGDGSAAEEVRVLLATDEFFEVVGVLPELGRGFVRGESDSTAGPVVVLGHEIWVRRFGSDVSMVGRDVFLDGQPTRVIGVMPRGFRFAMHSSLGDPVTVDVYEVMQADLAAANPGAGAFAGLARIREGASEGVVAGALDAVSRQLDEESFGRRGLRLWTVPLREDLIGEVRPVLGALLGASIFLLLTLGANLATLLFARAASRSRDVAVRSALGAGRFASVMNLLGESLLLCLAGGVLGLAITPFAVEGLLALAPPSLPRQEAIGLDTSVLVLTLCTAGLLALAAALGPALRVSGRAPWEGLRASGPRAGGAVDAARTRSILVAVQVALSLVLLASAGLVARSVAMLLRADPGFESAGVLTFRVPLSDFDDADGSKSVRFHEQLGARFTALPGVRGAGAVDAIPLASGANQTTARFPDAPGNTGDANADGPLVDYFATGRGYFDAIGIALLDGRAFDIRDDAQAPGVAIIDETLARRFFDDGRATGRRMTLDGDTLAIVGVTRHARFYDLFSDDRGQVYRPLAQMPRSAMYYALRTDGEPRSLIESARTTLRSLDASVPIADVRTMDTIVRESLGQHRLSMVLIAGFALGALVLAAMGIYGVVSNSVLRRTHEFGVRLALGADRPGILGLVLAQGVRVIGLGLAVGLAGAIGAARLLSSLLFGVQAGDTTMFVIVGLFLATVGLLACLMPAWRATRIAPIEALRGE
jgi:putative ABC transport system permease protein